LQSYSENISDLFFKAENVSLKNHFFRNSVSKTLMEQRLMSSSQIKKNKIMTYLKLRNERIHSPKEISEWLDNFRNFDVPNAFDRLNNFPPANVQEHTDGYMIELAAPGRSKEDFTVKANQGILEISSKTENKSEEKTDNFTRREFSLASFTRTFHLPESVNTENIGAEYKDGILRIALPKREEAKAQAPREIKIS
jgi:HSP20 family protein